MVQVPRWQVILVLCVLLAGIVFALPNALSTEDDQRLASWLPHEQINLGLDLQGGSYLLLEADLNDVIGEELGNLLETLRFDLRRNEISHGALGVENRSIVINGLDPESFGRVREMANELSVFPGQLEITTEDDSRMFVAFSDTALQQKTNDIMQRVLQIIRLRLDETGTKELSLQRQGADRVLVLLPGVQDPEWVKNIINQQAVMNFRFVDETVVPGAGPVPAGAEVLPSREQGAGGTPLEYAVRKRIMVKGDQLTDAQATFQDNRPVVSFRFDAVGATKFARATQEKRRAAFRYRPRQ